MITLKMDGVNKAKQGLTSLKKLWKTVLLGGIKVSLTALSIITKAIELGASDVHLTVFRPPIQS